MNDLRSERTPSTPEWRGGALEPRPGAAGSKGSKLPPALTAPPDVMGLLRALQYRWALALGLGLAAAVVTTFAAWKLVPRPKYKATTIIRVATFVPKIIFPTSENHPDFKIYQATQLGLIKSRLVLNAALRRPEVAALESTRLQDDPVGWLEAQLKVDPLLNSELIQVSLAGDRPRDLAALVNAVADAYMEEVVSKERKDRDSLYEKLQRIYADQQQALTSRREHLRNLAESVGSDNRQNLALQQKVKIEQLAVQQKELIKVQLELKRQRIELVHLEAAEAAKTVAEIGDFEIGEHLEKDGVVVTLKERVAELTAKIARTRRTIRNPSDPVLTALHRDMESTRKALEQARERLWPEIAAKLRAQNRGEQSSKLADLRTLVRINDDMEKELLEGIERLNRESQSFNVKAMDLHSKQDEIAQKEAAANLIGKEVEAMAVELQAPSRIEWVNPAEEPLPENSQKRKITILMAALGMFSCTVMGVSWREYRARRLGSADEIVDGLGMRLLGTLPALPDRTRQAADSPLATNEPHWQSLLIESIDAARTMLLHDCRNEAYRVLMVTSAMNGEGKSSLACHLAISLARTGRRTLLVDFDLRNPSVHRLFDAPAGPGVSELLRDEASLDQVIRPVLGDLDVVTAGRCDAEALRALAQDRLPRLFEQFRESHDFIIVDSAPTLPVVDSLLIGQHVDAAIFSVYREVSRIPTVYAGYQRLANLGTRLLGVVVTGVPSEHFGEEAHYPAMNRH